MKKVKKQAARKARQAAMIPNILQLLTQAIHEKLCIAIRYHDQRHVRVVEPHAVYTQEGGEVILDAFQTRGYSSSGRPPPFWRPFRLKKIGAISLLKENFETRTQEGFSRDKDKYRSGLVAIVDGRRQQSEIGTPRAAQIVSSRQRKLYTQPQPEDVGPNLPKNPFRR